MARLCASSKTPYLSHCCRFPPAGRHMPCWKCREAQRNASAYTPATASSSRGFPMNSRRLLWLAAALLLAAPAHAIESPLAYARSTVKLVLKHPKDTAHATLALDAEIRSEESTVHTPG